jgi:hypothetical protein
MPRCCAGDRCEFPSLGLHGGPGGIKNCPDCGEKIHDLCAFEDDDAGLSERNVCPDCWDPRKPRAEEDDPREDEASRTSSRSRERDDASLASSRTRDQGEEASHASSREEAELRRRE